MSCKEYDERLSAYHDGELGRGPREDVEAHLSQCASCRARLESLRELSGLLAGGSALLEPPARGWGRIRYRASRELPGSPALWLPRTAAAFIGFVLVLGGAVAVGTLSEEGARSDRIDTPIETAPRAQRPAADAVGHLLAEAASLLADGSASWDRQPLEERPEWRLLADLLDRGGAR